MDADLPFSVRYTPAVVWSWDGRYIAAATHDDANSDGDVKNQKVIVNDAVSNTTVLTIPVTDPLCRVDYVAWTADNAELVIYDPRVARYDARPGQQGQLLGRWRVNGMVTDVSYQPHDQCIALVVRLRLPSSNKLSLEHTLQIRAVHDGSIIVDLTLPLQYDEMVDWLGWSPDGTCLALLNRKGTALIYAWNGTALTWLREFSYGPYDRGFSCGAWSPDSRHLAISTDAITATPSVVIYDVQTGTPVQSLQESGAAYPLAWSPVSNWIASFIDHHTKVRIWDALTGQVVEDIDCSPSMVSSMAWSPNGTLALGRWWTAKQIQQNSDVPVIAVYRPGSKAE